MQITADEADIGARLACENAWTLVESAALLGRQGKFGVAAALCVLSCEESSKAIALINRANGNDDPYVLREVFRNHLIKHEIGYASILPVRDALVSLGISIEFHPEHKIGGKIQEWLESWKTRADKIKQEGFYVDHQQGKWLTPSKTENTEYTTSMLVAAMAVIGAKSMLPKLSS
jgi:AbiV family abortive infection protein